MTTPTHLTKALGVSLVLEEPGSTGLSIIPASTPLTRLNYFDGKYLRAEDMRLEQAYIRTLVALSVRGAGWGVVHGFEVTEAGGDLVRLHGGLAVSPSGTVIDLPADAQVSLTELLTRADPGSVGAGGGVFGPCAQDVAASPDVTIADQPLYLLTVASEEALCGEEERFDHLCSDACLTETDRPRRLEGVRLRARRLALGSLPTSTAATLTQVHLRSRVATAYFAAERATVADLRSAAGLRNPAWCAGALGVSGDEVPVAVLARSGTTTSLLDLWTARRELVDPPAARYWAGRLGMRTWDEFLAEVLQFQCQLADDGPTPGTTPAGTDPCAPLRTAYGEVRGALAELGGTLADDADRHERASGALGPELLQKLLTLHHGAGDLLTPPAKPAAADLLDAGFVTLPPAGFLPVDPQRPVVDQLSPLFGAGVDLRYYVAPADHLAELMRERQDMNRISLTAGLDDPSHLEPVDIYVPDGTTGTAEGQRPPIYSGAVKVLPQTRGAEEASVALVKGVAKDLSDGNVSWVAAGHTEIPQRVPFTRAMSAMMSRFGRTRRTDPAEPDAPEGEETERDVELPVTADATLKAVADRPETVMRLNRERLLSRARRLGIEAEDAVAGPTRVEVAPDRPIGASEARTVDVWLDFTIDVPLADAAIGDRARLTGLLAMYSRASRTPIAQEATMDLALEVVGRVDQPGQGPSGPRTVIIVRFSGDAVEREFGTTSSTETGRVSGRASLTFSRSALRAQLVGVTDVTFGERTPVTLGAYAVRTATSLSGGWGVSEPEGVGRRAIRLATGWSTAAGPVTQIPGVDRNLATFEGSRDDACLDVARPDRDLVEAVIESIAAGLAAPDRDPGFAARARRLLLADQAAAEQTVTAVRDWVMFARRRDVRGLTERPPEVPPATKTFVAYHAILRDVPLKSYLEPDRSDEYERVGTVEFQAGDAAITTPLDAIRSAWSSQPRGDELVLQLVAERPPGDGDAVSTARLAAYRSAISGLIDATTASAPITLPDIPPDFASPGIDGVIFTVGRPHEPKRVSHTMFAVRQDLLPKLDAAVAAQFGGYQNMDWQALRDMTDFVNQDYLDMDFLDGQVEDPDEVKAWWAGQSTRDPYVIILHPVVPVDDASTQQAVDEETSLFNGSVYVRAGDPMDRSFGADAVSVWLIDHFDGMVIVSVSEEQKKRLDAEVTRLGGWENADPAEIRALVSKYQSFTAHVDAGQVRDEAAMREWWVRTAKEPTVTELRVHPSAGAVAGADPAAGAETILTALGVQGVQPAVEDAHVSDALGSSGIVFVVHG